VHAVQRDFRGQKKEAPPYPRAEGRSPPGPALSGLPRHSRRRLHGNLPASPYGPFIVELFAFGDLLRYPHALPCGSRPHERAGSRRWRTLNAPRKGSRTPWADLGPEAPRTDFRHDGSHPAALSTGHESVRIALVPSPPARPAQRHCAAAADLRHYRLLDRTLGLLLPAIQRQLRITPASLHRARTSHSRGIRLYRQSTCRWSSLPLSVVGGHVYRVCSPDGSASQRVCVIDDRRARS